MFRWQRQSQLRQRRCTSVAEQGVISLWVSNYNRRGKKCLTQGKERWTCQSVITNFLTMMNHSPNLILIIMATPVKSHDTCSGQPLLLLFEYKEMSRLQQKQIHSNWNTWFSILHHKNVYSFKKICGPNVKLLSACHLLALQLQV